MSLRGLSLRCSNRRLAVADAELFAVRGMPSGAEASTSRNGADNRTIPAQNAKAVGLDREPALIVGRTSFVPQAAFRHWRQDPQPSPGSKVWHAV